MNRIHTAPARQSRAIPRGLLQTGPVLFSYGFRPFFLGAAVWALIGMLLWLWALRTGLTIAGDYGARAWHAHEMLFGFGSAVLAGFLLTAIPNWTGRLPVSGHPLALLFLLWCAGRVALVSADFIGVVPATLLESLFLPALLAISAREVIAGRKWADLKVLAGLTVLTLANICFHVETLRMGGPDASARLGVAAYVILIMIIGGRILPSFTRNWLNKQGRTDFPTPYNGFDRAVIVISIPALVLWVGFPDYTGTGVIALVTSSLQFLRLLRWRGWTTWREPIVLVLHVAYAFVALGFLAIAAGSLGLLPAASATHVLTIGTVTTMMIAVMTRATRGHTGRDLTASRLTCLSYLCIFACALTRPAAGVLPEHSTFIYDLSGTLWLAAIILFLVEYAPMLALKRRQPTARN